MTRRRISLSICAISIGGIVGVGGIERDTYTNRENTNTYTDNNDDNDEIEAISRNQQEVVDFYYKIKEYFLEHTELCSRVPDKRATWSDVDTDADDDDEPDANTELNMKISDAMLCPPPTAPIPIPPPNPNYCVRTAITEPKN